VDREGGDREGGDVEEEEDEEGGVGSTAGLAAGQKGCRENCEGIRAREAGAKMDVKGCVTPALPFVA